MHPLSVNLFKLDMLMMSFKHYFYFALKMTLLPDFVGVISDRKWGSQFLQSFKFERVRTTQMSK